MPVAYNPDTGEAVRLNDGGQWVKTDIAANPQTGEKLAFDGQGWTRVDEPKGVMRYADNIVRQIANGATFGLADEFAAKANSLVGKGEYDKNLEEERRRDLEFKTENPIAANAAEIGGNVAGTIAGGGLIGRTAQGAKALGALDSMKIAPRAATVGGLTGVASGFGNAEGGVGERVEGAVKGGVMGTALGTAAVPVARIAGDIVGKGVNAISSRMAPEAASTRKLAEAIGNDGMSADRITARLRMLGDNATIADAAGPNVRLLAEGLANEPGVSSRLATRVMEGRANRQGQRVLESAQQGLGAKGDYYGTADDLLKARSAAAAPLYEEAFKGGSTAPLQNQLESAFADAVAAESGAAKAVQQAQQAMTLARANVSRAGNDVYAANGAMASDRSASAQLQEAQQALASAQAAKSGILERLHLSQNDAATNAPGAVWSPRVQQFLDDPIAKAGLSRGLEVQRLESLAAGKRFNPAQLAITGMDDAGNPIVSKVPNLRTLDAVKRGLDDILEGYRDGTTGKLVLDQRGRAVDQVRKSLVNQLDELTGGAEGAYAKARAAWAGPSQSLDAMAKGRNFLRGDSEVTAKVVDGMSDSEREFFREGVMREIKAMVDRGADGNDKVRQFLRIPKNREALQVAFPDRASFLGFMKDMTGESIMARSRNEILKGSQTARRQAAQADTGADASGVVSNAASGNVTGAVRSAVGTVVKKFGDMPQAQKDALGRMLFSTDAVEQQKALKALGKNAQMIGVKKIRKSIADAGFAGAIGGTTGRALAPQD